MEIYQQGENTLIREIDVSMDTRESPAVVHLMQGEDVIPVIAAHLYFDGQPYAVPENARINVRACKPDKARVYNPCLGVSEDRTTAYIEVTQQMTAAAGMGSAAVEIVLDGVAMTGAFVLEIDESPAPDPVIESEPEYEVLLDAIKKAEDAADDAKNVTDAANKAEEARKKAEEERVKTEESRVSAEAERASAETERVSAEGKRDAAEADRASAEGLRETAEQARDAAEQDREEAEQERAAGEQARMEGERARADAEQQRAEAEQTRNTAEEERKSAEAERKKAEEARDSAEKTRAAAEKTRETNEQSRKTEESNRVKQEADRVTAEEARKKQEQERSDAEKLRVEAEKNRATAETGRANAEKTRTTSEEARVKAEEARAKQATENQEIVDKYTEFAAEVEALPPSSDPYARVEQEEKKTTLFLGIPMSNFAYATFWIDLVTRQLMMRVPNGFSAITFAIKNREMVVRING